MTEPIKHYRQLLGIAKSWAEKDLPGWCDELHRALITRHGAMAIDGRASASTMNLDQLNAALADYEKRGWQRTRSYSDKGQHPAKKVSPQIGSIVSWWGKLDQAGKLQKDGSRAAMLRFCGNQVKRDIPNLDALTATEAQRIIEALKAWSRR